MKKRLHCQSRKLLVSGYIICATVTVIYLFQSKVETASKTEDEHPSKEFEITRRRILTETRDMRYYINAELQNIANTTNDRNIIERSKRILEENEERHRSILHHIRHLSSMDGYEEWRTQEEKELAAIVQNRLHHLQNPKDCSKAKKVVCEAIQGNYGFSFPIGHLLSCLVIAYNSQRTMLLSDGWKLGNMSWEHMFKPSSDTCLDTTGNSTYQWIEGVDKQVWIIKQGAFSPMPQYMPLAIPEDLSERLIRLHGKPGVWWLGQLYRYLLRPQESLVKFLTEKTSEMNFKNPIVGVHIRRTDKIQMGEASFHSLDEYMVHVEDHYKLLELETPGIQRRVYLATDDPPVLEEAKTKYPQYIFLGDSKRASLASQLSTRYTNSSWQGFIADIHLLSKCDFLVCTISSGICRLAYALMQTYHPDASARVQSLDDIFYFYVQSEPLQRAIMPHVPRDPSEIDLQVGDLIHAQGNFWNGSSDGINNRTNKDGNYPSYKAEDIVNVFKMPVNTYPDETS